MISKKKLISDIMLTIERRNSMDTAARQSYRRQLQGMNDAKVKQIWHRTVSEDIQFVKEDQRWYR